MICDWSDRKNYLIHYRMLEFYVRHCMEVVKLHTGISFKQSKWLEKYISFKYIAYSKTHFLVKQWEM